MSSSEVQLLLTSKASIANVETVLLGLVQSKMQNRPGIVKISKLVFLF